MAVEIGLFNGSKEADYPGYRRRVLGQDWLSWEFTLREFRRKSEIKFMPAVAAKGFGSVDALEDFNFSQPYKFNGIGLFLYEEAVPVVERKLIALDLTISVRPIEMAGERVSLTPSFQTCHNASHLAVDDRDRHLFLAISWALSCPPGESLPIGLGLNIDRHARHRLAEAKPCSL